MPEDRASDSSRAALLRAGLAVYCLAWGVLFLATLAMPILAAAQLASFAGPPPGSRAAAALPFGVEIWLLYSLNLLPALFLTAAAALLFRRRGRDPVAMILSFSFLCSAASMPFVEPWLARWPLQGLRELVEYSAPLTGILGMLLFPNGRFVPRWMAVPALLLVPWTVARLFHALSTPVDIVLNDLFGACVIASVLIRYHRLAAQSPQRQQLRWATFGIAIGLVLNNLAMALFLRMSLTPGNTAPGWMLLAARALLIGFYVAMPGGLLVSLLRYRLYDADEVISRSAALAATTVLLGAVFAGSAEVVKLLIEQVLDQDAGMIPAAVAAALATLVISPAHHRLRKWASRRFQHSLDHMRRDLPLAVGDRRETATLDELLADLLARIAAGTRAQRLAVLLRDKSAFAAAAFHGATDGEVDAWLAARVLDDHGQLLDCDRDDARFPLRIPLRVDDTDRTLIGWLLLGPRPDGSFYGRDEREVLAEIADPVARAIRIVEQREARERRWQSQQRHQQRRITALERKLAELVARTAEAGGASVTPAVRSAGDGRSRGSSRARAARG